MELIHGGDAYGYMQRHGGRHPLDFSVNINPIGLPESVRRALKNAEDLCCVYPDPLCRALRKAIAQKEGVPPAYIYCGNGAADILYLLAQVLAPQCALIPGPCFAEYENSLAGSRMIHYPLQAHNEFRITEAFLSAITPQTDIVYLCQPNNPTGKLAEPALLEKIVERCREAHAWLIVDECFIGFTGQEACYSAKAYLESYPQLILIKAFTKFYAIPGVRLGYCISADTAFLNKLRQAGQPWNVSSFAQVCGIAALEEDAAYTRETISLIASERQYLADGLKRLALRVFESEANFILFWSADTALHKKLEAHGIMIRCCANFRGLVPGYYRIAVRTREENERLLACIKECL